MAVTSHTRTWLIKSEPEVYSFEDLERERVTAWTGVRSFAARLHLRAMHVGDRALFYHSQTDKAVVGLCEIARQAYPDPTATDGEWSAVDVRAVVLLPRAVTLDEIRARRTFAKLPLLTQSRLSVMPVPAKLFDAIIEMAGHSASPAKRRKPTSKSLDHPTAGQKTAKRGQVSESARETTRSRPKRA